MESVVGTPCVPGTLFQTEFHTGCRCVSPFQLVDVDQSRGSSSSAGLASSRGRAQVKRALARRRLPSSSRASRPLRSHTSGQRCRPRRFAPRRSAAPPWATPPARRRAESPPPSPSAAIGRGTPRSRPASWPGARRRARPLADRRSRFAPRITRPRRSSPISPPASVCHARCVLPPFSRRHRAPRTRPPPDFFSQHLPRPLPARSRPRLTPNPTPTPPPDPKLRRSDLPIHPGRQPSRRDPSAVHPHRPLPPHPPRPLPHRHSRRPRRLRRLLHPPPPPRPAFLLHRRFHPRP